MSRPLSRILALCLLATAAGMVLAGDPPPSGIVPEPRLQDFLPPSIPSPQHPSTADAPIAPGPPIVVVPECKRPADAFSETALVVSLLSPEAKEKLEKEQGTTERPTLEDYANAHCLKFLDCRFDEPANFPLPKFGPQGEPLSEDGVVIHEGMRLVATQDGRYEVSFVATTRAMPVTTPSQTRRF
jgi:hypothetical protein